MEKPNGKGTENEFKTVVTNYGFDQFKKIQNCSYQLQFYDVAFHVAQTHQIGHYFHIRFSLCIFCFKCGILGQSSSIIHTNRPPITSHTNPKPSDNIAFSHPYPCLNHDFLAVQDTEAVLSPCYSPFFGNRLKTFKVVKKIFIL